MISKNIILYANEFSPIVIAAKRGMTSNMTTPEEEEEVVVVVEEHQKPLLLVNESRHNADMYYATRFLSADPIIYLCLSQGREDLLIVSQMEYERARKESIVKEIRSTLDYGYNLQPEELILKILRDEGVDAIEVPKYFPVYTADALRREDIEVIPVEKVAMAKEREIKTEQELNYMRKAQRACEDAMGVAIEVIKNSSMKDNYLVTNGEILTAELLKAYIEHALIDSGCSSDAGEPIVGCGNKTADPHYSGHGPVSAHDTIIIDIFPRLNAERYFADMTRTVVKGEPPKELTEMYAAVMQAQDAALELVKAGVRCKEVHGRVCDIFEEKGYGTLRIKSKNGFIHSTGHGVGLDLHENPHVGDNDYELCAGNVITIEPGLYDPEVGGVRLEDMVLVLKNGCENLTQFERKLVI